MPAINPEYFQAVAHEERNRYRSYFDHAPTLELPLIGGRRFPFPVVNLRWHHVIDLLRSGNAFLTGMEPLAGDFEEFLWRLHPFYRTPTGSYPNLRSHEPRPFWLYSRLSRFLIRFVARQLILPAAEKLVRERIRDAQQDRPSLGNGADAEVSAAAPTLTELDHVAMRLALAGWSRAQILGENVAFTYQVLRAADLVEGHGSRYVPPSARLLKFVPEAPTP